MENYAKFGRYDLAEEMAIKSGLPEKATEYHKKDYDGRIEYLESRRSYDVAMKLATKEKDLERVKAYRAILSG